jgi:hypothetical protein
MMKARIYRFSSWLRGGCAAPSFSQEGVVVKIQDVFYYDLNSPSGLMWKVTRYSGNGKPQALANTPAGGLNSNGRYEVRFQGRLTQCHRIVYELLIGEIPEGMIIDHIDGDGSNNNINNLRVVTDKLNARNRKMEVRNTTGVTGVHPYKFPDGRVKGYVATWREAGTGKSKSKSFSFRKFGEEAFDLACEYRKKIIEKLNELGEGYTLRHGTKLD